MATNTGSGKMRDDENKITEMGTGPGGTPGYGSEGKNENRNNDFAGSRSENWTGNEERLYTGSGTATKGPMRSVSGRGASGNTAEDLWQAGQEHATETLGALTDKARDFGSNVAEKARGMASNISDTASHAGEYVTNTVKSNPIQSLLIGFGLGCLVGVLVTGTIRR